MDDNQTQQLAKLVDMGITVALAGLEREAIVDFVRQREEAGDTADEITDALQSMRQAREADLQGKIDQMP